MPKHPAPSAASALSRDEVTCPFCGLLCDDLTLPVAAGSAPVGACTKATLAYAAAAGAGAASVGGEPVPFARALTAARKLLKASRRPLFTGLGTDVQGLRALFRLAERSGATVDHMHSSALNASLRVLQSRGWQTTTLSEIRNRADLVIVLGVDLDRGFPRFLERHVAPPEALQPARRARRRVVYLGPPEQAPRHAEGLPLQVVACALTELADSLRLLEALVRGLPLGQVAAGNPLRELAEAIASAEYPVFVWAPGQLPGVLADLIIAAACELVAHVNTRRRAAGLALGGDDGAQSALAVSTWLTGFATGIGFAGGEIEARGELGGTANALAEGGADLILHLTSFSQRPPPEAAVPRILLAPPGFAGEAPASVDVFLPIGVPGVDHDGQLIRTDGVVALPLRAMQSARHPPASAVLASLLAGLEKKK